MADNWSASPLTLTDAGDWAEWTLTLSSTDADNLNNPDNDPLNRLTLRMALSGVLLRGDYALMVNDTTATSGMEAVISTNDWVSDNSFAYSNINGTNAVGKSQAVDFPNGAEAVVNVEPWVAGANTIRFVWFGDTANDNASEPIEIDFLAVQSGGPAYITVDWTDTGDDDFDAKPVTTGSHVGYDDHVDPDPLGIGGTPPATWILEGSDATTGTAGDSLLEVIKFCPPVAKIRVTGSGSPVSGIAGVDQGGVAVVTTLSGAGIATFTLPGGFADANFWFGGSDDWAPAHVNVDASDRIRCGGWHVGRIGVD